MQDPIPILASLQKLPRSGKRIRLLTFEPRIQIRTVYDHIFSVAHTADCLLPIISHKIHDNQRRDLALCIAYHELNEIVLGDIPSYTKLNAHAREAARILSQPRLKEINRDERERVTHEFIALFLDARERGLIKSMLEIFANAESPVFQLFHTLDKIDPIIATWRYLHHYRDRLGSQAETFLQRMTNFFQYPEVPKIAASYMHFSGDSSILDLITGLRNEQLAADYYDDRYSFLNLSSPFGSLDTETAIKIIEGVGLFIKRSQ